MKPSDRERKREWKAQQRADARATFPLSDPLLESLFESVERSVDEHGCDHTLRFTEQWLLDHPGNREQVIDWLQQNGGYCDCEVCGNAADYWKQNRQ